VVDYFLLHCSGLIVAAGQVGGDDQVGVSSWVQRCGNGGRHLWLSNTTTGH